MKITIFHFILISLVTVGKVSAGVRSKKEQFQIDSVIDSKEAQKLDNVYFDSTGRPVETYQSHGNSKLSVSDRVKRIGPNDRDGKAASPRQSASREPMRSGSERKSNKGKKDLMANLTVEYVPGRENDTWNVEKFERVRDADSDNEKCKVTTEDLVATAQATVLDTLKGLCSSSDMEDKFYHLENSLMSQLNALKNVLIAIEKKLGPSRDGPSNGQKWSVPMDTKDCSGTSVTSVHPEINLKNQNSGVTKSFSNTQENHGFEKEDESEMAGVRDAEILKYNSSIHLETGVSSFPKKVFTYYWKIKNMTYKLAGVDPRKSYRSPSFYIFPGGYRMYLRVFPRENEDTLYVRVGLTKGEFDNSLQWPFLLRHKIHILDQTTEGQVFEDIASRTWDPSLICGKFNWQKPVNLDNEECVEVAFPHDVLRQREYIKRDTLIIKLTVYLEA